jgi:hypothetical protein
MSEGITYIKDDGSEWTTDANNRPLKKLAVPLHIKGTFRVGPQFPKPPDELHIAGTDPNTGAPVSRSTKWESQRGPEKNKIIKPPPGLVEKARTWQPTETPNLINPSTIDTARAIPQTGKFPPGGVMSDLRANPIPEKYGDQPMTRDFKFLEGTGVRETGSAALEVLNQISSVPVRLASGGKAGSFSEWVSQTDEDSNWRLIPEQLLMLGDVLTPDPTDLAGPIFGILGFAKLKKVADVLGDTQEAKNLVFEMERFREAAKAGTLQRVHADNLAHAIDEARNAAHAAGNEYAFNEMTNYIHTLDKRMSKGNAPHVLSDSLRRHITQETTPLETPGLPTYFRTTKNKGDYPAMPTMESGPYAPPATIPETGPIPTGTIPITSGLVPKPYIKKGPEPWVPPADEAEGKPRYQGMPPDRGYTEMGTPVDATMGPMPSPSQGLRADELASPMGPGNVTMPTDEAARGFEDFQGPAAQLGGGDIPPWESNQAPLLPRPPSLYDRTIGVTKDRFGSVVQGYKENGMRGSLDELVRRQTNVWLSQAELLRKYDNTLPGKALDLKGSRIHVDSTLRMGRALPADTIRYAYNTTTGKGQLDYYFDGKLMMSAPDISANELPSFLAADQKMRGQDIRQGMVDQLLDLPNGQQWGNNIVTEVKPPQGDHMFMRDKRLSLDWALGPANDYNGPVEITPGRAEYLPQIASDYLYYDNAIVSLRKGKNPGLTQKAIDWCTEKYPEFNPSLERELDGGGVEPDTGSINIFKKYLQEQQGNLTTLRETNPDAYDAMMKSRDRLRMLADEPLKYAVERGVITPEKAKEMQDFYGDTYVPLNRIIEEMEKVAGDGRPNPYKKRVGSQIVSDNVVANITNNWMSSMAWTDEQVFLRDTIDGVLKHQADNPGEATVMEIIPWKKGIAAPKNSIRFQMESKWYVAQVHDNDLYMAITGVPAWNFEQTPVAKEFAEFMRWSKLSGQRLITSSLPFAQSNTARDIPTALIQVPFIGSNTGKRAKSFKEFCGNLLRAPVDATWFATNLLPMSFMDAITGTPFIDFLRQQGRTGMAGFWESHPKWSRAVLENTLNKPTLSIRLFGSPGNRLATGGVFHPVSEFQTLSEYSETMTRLASSKIAMQKLGQSGDLTMDDLMDVANVYKKSTVDFREGGRGVVNPDKYIRFLRANMSGKKTIYDMLRHDPAGTMAKFMLFVGGPTAMYWLWKKDDPDYRALPPELKNYGWWLGKIKAGTFQGEAAEQLLPRIGLKLVPSSIKSGFMNVVIPKPHDWGILSTLIELNLDYWTKRDPKALERMYKVMGQSLPSLSPLSDYYYISKGQTPFFKTPMFSESAERTPIRDLGGPKTSYSLRKISSAIPGTDKPARDYALGKPGLMLSPPGLQTMLNTHTGKWGSMFFRTLDTMLGEGHPSQTPDISMGTPFLKPDPSQTVYDQDLKKLYDHSKGANGIFNRVAEQRVLDGTFTKDEMQKTGKILRAAHKAGEDPIKALEKAGMKTAPFMRRYYKTLITEDLVSNSYNQIMNINMQIKEIDGLLSGNVPLKKGQTPATLMRTRITLVNDKKKIAEKTMKNYFDYMEKHGLEP